MRTIKILLEYTLYPLYEYDEKGMGLGSGIIEGLFSSETEKKLINFQKMYDDLFIDNEKDFSYKGFDNIEDEKNFYKEIYNIYLQIGEEAGDRYKIVWDEDLLNDVKKFIPDAQGEIYR